MRARHLPPGPKTPDELLRWEARAARALEAEPEALMRLRCHAMRGVCFYSSLSGADCAGEALERGFHGIFERVGASAVERTDWLQRLHTCDRAEASIKFLTVASKEAGSRECHFCDFFDRLPPHLRAELQLELVRAEEALPVAQPYDVLYPWLDTRRAALFPMDARSW